MSRRVWLRRCGFSEEGEGTGPRLPVRHSADLPSLPLLDAGSFWSGGQQKTLSGRRFLPNDNG